MTNDQALANLYNASRTAKLTAEEHQLCVQSAQVLQEFITPKKDFKKDDPHFIKESNET